MMEGNWARTFQFQEKNSTLFGNTFDDWDLRHILFGCGLIQGNFCVGGDEEWDGFLKVSRF